MTPYYDAAGITIYHADARSILPTLRTSLILTDPPYGVTLGRKRSSTVLQRKSYGTYDDTPESLKSLVADIWPMMQESSQRIVLTPGVKNMWLWPQPDHVGAFYYPAAVGCNSWGFSCWQPIFYYGKDPYGGKGSRPDSFISYEAAEPNGHPCPKPIGQWTALLSRASIDGDTVVDPFMGSGTTLRAAKDLGMRAIGIEVDERYCDIAVRRLAQGVLFGQSAA